MTVGVLVRGTLNDKSIRFQEQKWPSVVIGGTASCEKRKSADHRTPTELSFACQVHKLGIHSALHAKL